MVFTLDRVAEGTVKSDQAASSHIQSEEIGKLHRWLRSFNTSDL